jgi:hypothetical protein
MSDLTTTEILDYYLGLHQALGTQANAPDKPEFDKQHLKIWAKCEEELAKRKVKLSALTSPTPEQSVELKQLKELLLGTST